MPIAPTPPQFSTVRSQPRQRSSQECRLRRRGTGSVRDGENQARISRRGSNLSVSGALQVEEIREHAQYFRFLRGERRNRGLGGGEGGIRTPETLQIRGRNLAVPRSCGSLNHIVYAVCQDVAHFARECELSSALYASVFSASNQLSSIFPCRCPPRFRPFDSSCILIPNFRRRV